MLRPIITPSNAPGTRFLKTRDNLPQPNKISNDKDATSPGGGPNGPGSLNEFDGPVGSVGESTETGLE